MGTTPAHRNRSIHSRLAWLATLAACAALGCMTARSDGSDLPGQDPPTENPPTDPPTGDSPAYQLFATRAWPALTSCTACHSGSSAPAFQMPDTPRAAYTAILDAKPPLVDLDAPKSSAILRVHQNTAALVLDAGKQAAVLAWIQAEADARKPGSH